MPILNQKHFLRVLTVVIVLAGGLVVLHYVQAGRVPEALLWQADAALEKGKPDKAIFYLKQYLEFRPDDHDVAVRLADLMLERAASPKDVQNALFVYERVLREAPQRGDVAHKLVTLCIQVHRYSDALEHAQRLLETNATDGVLHAQVAQCLVAQNRADEARAEYEQALALAPAHAPAYEQYADLLERHFKKPQEAGALLDRLTHLNPDRPEAFLARARFLQRDGKLDECLRALDRVFLLDPENGEALVISAEVLQARGEVRRAREALRDAIATYPRYAHGYRALSWLELTGGNEADALATLERGTAVLPDAPDLLTPLADLWIERGDLERARDVVAKLDALQKATPPEGRRPFALRAGYLRGRLLMREGNWNEAFKELDGLRNDAQGMPGLAAQLNLLLAACHDHRGDRESQVEALRRALTADPSHLAARVALANAQLNAGRFEDAIKEYQRAARSPLAGLGVQITLASLRLSWARVSDAPDDEWTAIGTALDKLWQQHPESVEPPILRAEWLAARGDFVGAERQLRGELAGRPGDPRLWSALAGLVARSRGTLAAAQVVSEGHLAAGDSVELRLARARLWVDDIQPGRERRLSQLADLPATAGDAERTRLLAGLAELFDMIRHDSGRMQCLATLAAQDGTDLASRRALYALGLRGDDLTVRAKWREELRRAEGPSGKSAAVIEALNAATTGATIAEHTLAEWHDLAASVLAATPDHADAHLLAAIVAEQRNDLAEAVKHFDAATDLDPTATSCQAARLAFFLRTGQDDAARRTLVRLDADPRITGQRFRAVIERALYGTGSDAQAKCLAWLAARLKREPRFAVWAGRLLEGSGRMSEAIALYRQVTEAYPAFADGWSARLLSAAKVGEAEVNETTALAAKAFDRPAFFGVCAECGAAVRARVPGWSPPVSSAADRRVYAEVCVSACELRGRLEDAFPILNAVADDKDSRPEDAAWARRILAALTAALGTPEKKRDALNVLRGGGDKPTTVVEIRSRLGALTMALRTVTGEDRHLVLREMIGLLMQVVKDPAATSNDWYQLAQLHAAAGDRSAARECLQQMTRREPKNLFYVALVVDDLVNDNRLDEARPLVGRLADGVEDARVLSAAGRYHTLSNDPAAVLSLTDRFVRAADQGTTDGAVRQRQAADLLDRFTRLAAQRGLSAASTLLAAACERYRGSLRSFPEAVAPMAALMAFAGQVEPAFEELDRQRIRLSAATLATAGVAVVRTGRATPDQVQKVKGWIETALLTAPDSLPLRLNLGELLALQGNFTAAEPIYRDVLKADPKNLFALNNLAWILAARPEVSVEALALVDQAIAIGGVNPEVLDTRARVLISAGRCDAALADLAGARGPGGTPLQLFHLALAYERTGNSAEAIKAFREGRARGLDLRMIHPADGPAYQALAGRSG
jgi:tetratricopeptide (TPR) repeat protein